MVEPLRLPQQRKPYHSIQLVAIPFGACTLAQLDQLALPPKDTVSASNPTTPPKP